MALLLGSATALTGQTTSIDPLAPVCPAGKAPLADTAQVLVVIEPARTFLDSAYTAADRQQMAFIAEGIARQFVAPATLGAIPTLVDLPAYYRDGSDDGSRAVFTGRLVLILRKNGRLKTMAWEAAPMAQPLSLALVRAVQVADSAGEFDGIMPPETPAHPDTLVFDIRSRINAAPGAFPLMRARLAGYRGETLAMVIKRGYLEYPPNASRLRVGTEGEARFVVGSDGRAVEASIQVTRAGWRDFVTPMRKAIATSTFEPATSGGCKVPAFARQKFAFTAAR